MSRSQSDGIRSQSLLYDRRAALLAGNSISDGGIVCTERIEHASFSADGEEFADRSQDFWDFAVHERSTFARKSVKPPSWLGWALLVVPVA